MNAQRNSEADVGTAGFSDVESSVTSDGCASEGGSSVHGGIVSENGSFYLEQSRLRVVSLYQTLMEKRSMRF
ncbi:MAG: hypothetical protein KJ626_04180 [Verrucomicrobia bacterium]|nr:hypothetical protein [Verrucomicrobiota bacterium]